MKQNELDALPITLVLSVADVNMLLTLLGKRPFDEVADLILKVRSTALQQIAQASQPAVSAQPAEPIADSGPTAEAG